MTETTSRRERRRHRSAIRRTVRELSRARALSAELAAAIECISDEFPLVKAQAMEELQDGKARISFLELKLDRLQREGQ